MKSMLIVLVLAVTDCGGMPPALTAAQQAQLQLQGAQAITGVWRGTLVVNGVVMGIRREAGR